MRKSLLLYGMLFAFVTQALAQAGKITGKVTDAKDGSPLQGVTIKVKGGAVTNTGVNGLFTLNAPSSGIADLEVSSIGYLNKTVKATAGEPIYITLDLDPKGLSEVVVTGVGVATSKKKLGIAVESITADKLPAAPTADIGQALVGKIAGAQISSTNGSPGAPVNILLRGINSVRAGTAPMILLDGLEVRATSLESLDLTNIERVEVVQGAAAASIYGAQGANGVIQLFSKKGRGSKMGIDISSSIAQQSLLNVGGLQKARLHSLNTNASNEVVGGSGNPLVFDEDYSHYEENVIWNSTAVANNNNKAYDKNLQWYDHYKMFYKTATTFNNSIALSGSRDRMDFMVTASDNRQQSVFKGNGDYSRTNLTVNLGAEILKNLRFRTITQLVRTENNQLDPSGRTIVYALNNSRPFADYEYKGPDGNYGAYFGDATGVNGFNPNYMFQYGKVDDQTTDVIQNFNLNYRFNKFVELDAKYGINHSNQTIVNNLAAQDNNLNADFWQYWLEFYYPRTSYGSPTTATESGEINNQNYKTTFQNLLTTATVRFDFDRDLHLKIPLRSTTQLAYDYRKNVFKQFISYGLDAPSYTPYTASQMATYRIVSDFTQPFVTYGYLVNQRFEWGDLAGISGGFRSDYSSAFGGGSKPFTFPRGDAYLRVSALPFWQESLGNFWTEFKLRGAFGKAGIQPRPFDRYVVLNTRNIGDANTFVFPTTNPNPNLDVEVSSETEIGMDMSFKLSDGQWLRNLNFSATYWMRSTDNAIWPVDAAPSTGTGLILNNAFALESNGIQASLNIPVLSSKNLNWNFTTNFSKQTSKIKSVGGAEVVVTSNAGSSNYVLRAGEKIGQLYGYIVLKSVDQINPNTGQPFIDKNSQGNYVVASNGYVVDKNTRQPYLSADKFSFGDPNPKFNMSFINDLNFKGIVAFSMQWDWLAGAHLYNQTKGWMYRDGIHSDYDKQITIDGQTGAWTSFYRGMYAQRERNGTKDYFYEDASFWRLRNLSVAVDFSKMFKIPAFNRVQLVFTGRNLLTFTPYTGMDPEISSGASNSAWDRGVDHNTIPNVKTFQIGLNLGL